MKKALLASFVVLFAMSFAMAADGNYAPTSDVLGAHQNGGRGCAGCHTPHSGAFGSGQLTTDATTGNTALWAQDVQPLFGKKITSGPGYVTTFGATGTAWSDPEGSGLMMCLSCHDGNYTKTNMMANKSYEQTLGLLPTTYGSNPIPTLLGNDGTGTGNYLNDHPVGRAAAVDPGDWADPSIGMGMAMGTAKKHGVMGPAVIFTPGPGTYANFLQVYSDNSLTSLATDGVTIFPVCTTCHNQHSMNVAKATINGVAGTYQTFFFVRDPYNPGAQTVGAAVNGVSQSLASSATQFCRQCHFGDSNESNGAVAGTIPTAF